MSFGNFARQVRDPALPHRRRVAALRSCVQLYRPIGFEATLSFLHTKAGPFRTDEAALLRALAAVRGVPAALARYEDYRRHLAETLGIDPSPELRAQHAMLLSADRPVHSGLRYDADRMVGREADVAALRVLVRNHRLVSIVGTGGLGKTRLVQLLARSAEQPVVHV